MCIICFLRTHTVQLVLHAWFYQEHLIFVLTTVTTIFTATTTQVIVPEKYRSDFEDMQNRFAQLFDEVVEILENEESVTPERLKRYVSKIPEMSDSLDNAHTISDIIDIILKHSSLTCCTYLKGVARRFNISAVTEKIEKYHQFVSEFCQNELTHHIYMKPVPHCQVNTFDTFYNHHLQIALSPVEKTLSSLEPS